MIDHQHFSARATKEKLFPFSFRRDNGVECNPLNSEACGVVTHITGVGTAFPPNVFTQDEVRQLLGVTNPTVLKLLSAPHIKTRALYFDRNDDSEGGNGGKLTPLAPESSAALHNRFLFGLRDIGVRSAMQSIERASLQATDIDVVVAVTSSGIALPGFSAILIQECGLRSDVQRIDITGMGCNAGMSGLRTLFSAVRELSHRSLSPIQGLLVCCEVNSAIYVNNDCTGTGIVNSLFGDGAASLVVQSEKIRKASLLHSIADGFLSSPVSMVGIGEDTERRITNPHVALVDFQTATLTKYFDDMRYVVDRVEQQLNFKLSKQIPGVVGENAPKVVRALLKRNCLDPSNVSHWVVHTGGAKVIDGFSEGLGLNKDIDMRHTTSVLRDYGNISSGSFIASFERLVEESLRQEGPKDLTEGDIIVLVAMGPGTTIEAAVGIISEEPLADATLMNVEAVRDNTATSTLYATSDSNTIANKLVLKQTFVQQVVKNPLWCRALLLFLWLYIFVFVKTYGHKSTSLYGQCREGNITTFITLDSQGSHGVDR